MILCKLLSLTVSIQKLAAYDGFDCSNDPIHHWVQQEKCEDNDCHCGKSGDCDYAFIRQYFADESPPFESPFHLDVNHSSHSSECISTESWTDTAVILNECLTTRDDQSFLYSECNAKDKTITGRSCGGDGNETEGLTANHEFCELGTYTLNTHCPFRIDCKLKKYN